MNAQRRTTADRNRRERAELAAMIKAPHKLGMVMVGLVGAVLLWACLAAGLLVMLSGCVGHSSDLTRGAGAPQAQLTTSTNRATPKGDVATPTPSFTTCRVVTGIEGGKVNVRGGPGMNFPVVDVVSEGEDLILAGREDSGWVEVVTLRLVQGWFYCTKWCVCSDASKSEPSGQMQNALLRVAKFGV